jgi:hypothetical protein
MSLRRMMFFSLGNKIKNLIIKFKERVLNNNGLFEGELCLNTQLTDLDNKSVFDDASLILTPNGYEENLLFTVQPNDGTADFAATRTTIATRFNSQGLAETVTYNLPRLDYSGSTCPTLLTEPQLTNSWINNNVTSGYINNTNAVQGATISNAFGEGFDGFEYTFDSGTFLASSFNIRTFDTRGFPIQRLCFFVKNPSSDFFGINYTNATQVIYQFSTLTARDYYLSGNTGTINKINENTYALYMHMNNATTGQFSQVRVGFVGSLTSQVPITGSTILGLGYQQGSSGSILPLTYNPITTGASSVTKNVERLTKTGIENLIGQTEGTLLVKGYQFDRGIVLRIRNSGSTSLNRIAIFCASNDGKVDCSITKNGTAVNSTILTSPSVFKKNIAFVYSNLGFKVFINGAIIFTHTYAIPTDFTAALNTLDLGSVSERATARFELVALWKTQLTDEQAIQLTTL